MGQEVRLSVFKVIYFVSDKARVDCRLDTKCRAVERWQASGKQSIHDYMVIIAPGADMLFMIYRARAKSCRTTSCFILIPITSKSSSMLDICYCEFPERFFVGLSCCIGPE